MVCAWPHSQYGQLSLPLFLPSMPRACAVGDLLRTYSVKGQAPPMQHDWVKFPQKRKPSRKRRELQAPHTRLRPKERANTSVTKTLSTPTHLFLNASDTQIHVRSEKPEMRPKSRKIHLKKPENAYEAVSKRSEMYTYLECSSKPTTFANKSYIKSAQRREPRLPAENISNLREL